MVQHENAGEPPKVHPCSRQNDVEIESFTIRSKKKEKRGKRGSCRLSTRENPPAVEKGQ